jgi:hypothetical protein
MQLEGVTEIKDLAGPLGTTTSTLYGRTQRDRIPYEEIHAYCKANNISLEWVFNGYGPQKVDNIASGGEPLNINAEQLTNLLIALKESPDIPEDKLVTIVSFVLSREGESSISKMDLEVLFNLAT